MNLAELIGLYAGCESCSGETSTAILELVASNSQIESETRAIDAELTALVDREWKLAEQRAAFDVRLQRASFVHGERLRLAARKSA
jgi:hypothetical protein